ncbi:hypothetical protein H0A36_20575 [Endozoicomonas sp. SM1973]|uniref:Uncharacterized protein n=1 Tax=Spartinivicinus marinus TaxID=2994442 RepID=A0A853IGZ6_9GAMM|nr:hypothetical protein [Spartinivicinus marinus]MCX4028216.1 hypothetical protein [Spartinivicinus marinus]NYZ68415.1 hypothetical protein [Spartinivicinus marinus]
MANAVELSGYIVAFAGAARVAQAAMSTGTDPMTIAEYTFEINISADFDIKSDTDVKINLWRVNLNQKITTEYKNHWGIRVECKIKPAAVIAAET